MSVEKKEEIEFLVCLQRFTIHCVAHQSVSKTDHHCDRLLSAVQNLPKIYLGHKIQIALALESAAERNEERLTLNHSMKTISHLISLARPDFCSNDEEISKQWTGIDLNQLLTSCEDRFKRQSFSSTLWCQILNETSLVSTATNYFENCSFDFVQHDTDIEQLFQWINGNQIEIPGRFNRTYAGIPLFWCTPANFSQRESKYGSIRLIFRFSSVYSPTQHHLFDLGTRKNGSDIWMNILVTRRKQIAGYGNDFVEVKSISLSPVDIAIDLTDGPLIPGDVRITFVDHTQRCINLLPGKLTSEHACYHTSHSASIQFLRCLRRNQRLTLDQLKPLFDVQTFKELTQMNEILSQEERSD